MAQLQAVPTGAPVTQFPFGRDFQIGILALMSQRFDFLLTAIELFQPEYFEDKSLIWFFETMRGHYLKYKELPVSDPVITNELMKGVKSGQIKQADIPKYAEVAKKMRDKVPAQQYKIDECIRFCRRQAGRKAMLDSAPLMETADDSTWDEILERMQKITTIGASYINVGTNYFGTVKDRIARRATGDGKRIHSTGILQLDQLTTGGIKDGQLAVWLGGTGRGKSIALCHNGYIAVTHGRKVAHYTLELDEIEVTDRYDALYAQVPIAELAAYANTISQRVGNMQMRFGDALMVKSYPTRGASVNTIRSHMQMLEGLGWVPDFVIVDYGDLLKPLTNYQDEYADLGAIFGDLRGLAGEFNVPVWTATQSNRAGLNAEVIDIEHIGDSLKKAQIADVILALCANKDEIKSGVMRLFGAKNRNGIDKFEIKIETSYDKMTLYDVIKNAQSAQAAVQAQVTPQASMTAPPVMPTPLPPQPKPRRRVGKAS